MAIPFNPPEWLIQEYMNRKQPAEIANEGIQQALGTYIQLDAQQKAQQQANLGNYLKLIETDPQLVNTPIGQQLQKQIGGGLGGYQPPSVSTSTVPSVQNQVPQYQPMIPTSTENAAQSSIPSEHPISPIVAHLPASPQVPQMIVGRGKLGEKANAQAKLGLEMTKLGQGMEANEPASFEEVKTTFNAAGKPEIADELIKNAQALGQNTVQRKSVDAALKGLGVANTGIRGGALDLMAETRRQQLLLKTAEDYEKAVNPATAGGGSLVGIAGRANARADRALQVLRNPQMTYQDLSTVITDISGIFQGGVPHEQALREQKYGTALERLASIQTYLTGKPAGGMVTPEIRAKLKQVITDVKRVDNKIIEDNMRSKRNVFKTTSWAKENPTAIDDIENNIRSQYLAVGEESDNNLEETKTIPGQGTFVKRNGQWFHQ